MDLCAGHLREEMRTLVRLLNGNGQCRCLGRGQVRIEQLRILAEDGQALSPVPMGNWLPVLVFTTGRELTGPVGESGGSP